MYGLPTDPRTGRATIMKIAKNKVVHIDYKLTNSNNQIIDQSKDGQPLPYLHGNGNLIPGLESALEGKASGEELKVTVQPGDAYGERDEARVFEVPRSAFQGADNIEPGMRFQARTQKGIDLLTVVEVGSDKVRVDANHPLAGETLHFEVKIGEIREATEEELAHGHIHAHGQGCCNDDQGCCHDEDDECCGGHGGGGGGGGCGCGGH